MSTKKITQDMLIGQIVSEFPAVIPTLMACGMHCLGCPSSQMESLKDACFVHGLDADKVEEALNEALVEAEAQA